MKINVGAKSPGHPKNGATDHTLKYIPHGTVLQLNFSDESP